MKLYMSLSILFFSCSSYRLTHRVNPFAKFKVHSLAVPMFYNYTPINNLGHHFTSEFTQTLYRFKGLEVKAAGSKSVDAFLIGILRSSRRQSETLIGENPQRVGGGIERDFNVYGYSRLKMSVEVFLIRSESNTKEVLKLLQEKPDFSKGILGQLVLMREVIPIDISFAREIFYGENAQVNQTQNRALLEKVIKKQAQKAAKTFQHKILYAF